MSENISARGITFTIVFESGAINRDENLGNIQYIKKLVRPDGIYPYISRPFLRHHLFAALSEEPYSWHPATLKAAGSGNNNKVIQFDITKESIITSEELDYFGYLWTGEKGEKQKGESISRKAPVGMTKAIALEKWNLDTSFYANHGMVDRIRKQGEAAEPNPYSKDEFHGLFKYSVCIDLGRLGKDKVFVNKSKEIFGVKIEGKENSKDIEENGVKKGVISWKDRKNDFYEVTAEVDPDVKGKRLNQFIEVIVSGFPLHSSGESYTTSPLFLVAALVKTPMNVFDSFIELRNGKINAEALTATLNNPLIEKYWIVPLKLQLDGKEKLEVKTREGLLNDLEKQIEQIELYKKEDQQ